jgi:hypothetical protein
MDISNNFYNSKKSLQSLFSLESLTSLILKNALKKRNFLLPMRECSSLLQTDKVPTSWPLWPFSRPGWSAWHSYKLTSVRIICVWFSISCWFHSRFWFICLWRRFYNSLFCVVVQVFSNLMTVPNCWEICIVYSTLCLLRQHKCRGINVMILCFSRTLIKDCFLLIRI